MAPPHRDSVAAVMCVRDNEDACSSASLSAQAQVHAHPREKWARMATTTPSSAVMMRMLQLLFLVAPLLAQDACASTLRPLSASSVAAPPRQAALPASPAHDQLQLQPQLHLQLHLPLQLDSVPDATSASSRRDLQASATGGGLQAPQPRSYQDIYGNIFIAGAVIVGASMVLAVSYAIRARAALASLLPLG